MHRQRSCRESGLQPAHNHFLAGGTPGSQRAPSSVEEPPSPPSIARPLCRATAHVVSLPGHARTPGNKAADAEARTATTLSPPGRANNVTSSCTTMGKDICRIRICLALGNDPAQRVHPSIPLNKTAIHSHFPPPGISPHTSVSFRAWQLHEIPRMIRPRTFALSLPVRSSHDSHSLLLLPSRPTAEHHSRKVRRTDLPARCNDNGHRWPAAGRLDRQDEVLHRLSPNIAAGRRQGRLALSPGP